MPLKEKTKRLDSSDCPLEAGVAFPFDLVQLWLLLTSSSHALSQGCVCSLSTVREVEISHIDTEEGGPRRSGWPRYSEWSVGCMKFFGVSGLVDLVHLISGVCAELCSDFSSRKAFFVTQRNSPTGSFLLALKGTREAREGHDSELWGSPLFQFQTSRLLRRIAVDVKTQFCEQKENCVRRPRRQMYWHWLCASMRWSPW